MHCPSRKFDDELDVFDARLYFSGRIDHLGLHSKTYSSSSMKQQDDHLKTGGDHQMQSPKKETNPPLKLKQQPSTAGRSRVVATFFSSFFMQGGSKNKQKQKLQLKSASCGAKSSSCSSPEAESISGFSTPAASRYAPTTRQVYHFAKSRPPPFCLKDDDAPHHDGMDQRLQGLRVVRGGSMAIGDHHTCSSTWVDQEKKLAKEEQHQELDDGWGSDTSSDLFELEDLSVHDC